MHVRFSTAIGMSVVEDGSEEEIAWLSGILIHPDIGRIEGFFVRVNGIFSMEELFLSVSDILHWGNRIRVRSAEALSPIGELVRLRELADENRTMINQKIITESGAFIGMCRDVQFDTASFYLEWLFPKRYFRWGVPIPASSIVIVKPEGVVVRDAVTLPETIAAPSVLQTLDPLRSTTSSRVIQRSKQ